MIVVVATQSPSWSTVVCQSLRHRNGGQCISHTTEDDLGDWSDGVALAVWLYLFCEGVVNIPLDLRMRSTLFPVTNRTCGTPCESRRMTPICDGVKPFRASLQICSPTSAASALHHDGGVREYGRAEELIPFPLLCMRPIFLRSCQRLRIYGVVWSLELARVGRRRGALEQLQDRAT